MHGDEEEVEGMWQDAIRGLNQNFMYPSWVSGAVYIVGSGV